MCATSKHEEVASRLWAVGPGARESKDGEQAGVFGKVDEQVDVETQQNGRNPATP
jgi:hypothetical protein